MGFEASFGTKIQEVRRFSSSLKPSKFIGLSARHNRSKRVDEVNLVDSSSDEVDNFLKLDMEQVKVRIVSKKKQSPNNELQSSLKKEIVQLEKRLQDQFVERRDLEKALGYKSSSSSTSNENSMPKPASELIKEIAVLELEVVYLEQYLLSLYRKAFGRKVSSVSQPVMDERVKSPPITEKAIIHEDTGLRVTTKAEHTVQSSKVVPSLISPCKELYMTNTNERLLDSGIYRCHSALSQHSAFSNRTPTTMDSIARAVRSCHSQPLSYLENDTPYMISLAEHLGTSIADHVPDTPNKTSEDMIKCMSSIYCKLSDPPLMNSGFSFSPTSSLPSVSEYSPQDLYEMWSPRYRKESSFDARLDNSFHVDGGLKEFSGLYNTMVEVPWICRDSEMLNSIDPILEKYKSLVCKLEEVDVRKMQHDEKLAFWINIHNALVMHAAYKVGRHTVSADTIQNSILNCRMPRPGKWLLMLFSPKSKFKALNDRQAYAIEHPEPLLNFALCSGSHSDPAVRIYTPKRVTQELETAKEEYIRATIGLRKEHKLLLPKVVESFAKESCLSPTGVVEMIQQLMPEVFWKTTQGSHQGRMHKNIEWVPHNFAFRYLIAKELVK
ncbi:uncharacterized protein LOC113357110 isoform X2 [Papaver somniferum]|uniref:uncharacterized protein LOC113357110 isoform X2 n=1 Tax=Papaver somniferum TaxID=3469 RepID=UPI000E7044A6|nr:uncharacterized protein LOC113357110 isoform X2 [Papaver somniferum]